MSKSKFLSDTEKIQRHKMKIELLELNIRKKRRRIQIYSDDSDIDPAGEQLEGPNETLLEDDEVPVPKLGLIKWTFNRSLETGAGSQSKPTEAQPASEADTPATAVESPLDPALLAAALEESTSDTPEFGPSIHDNLANLWPPLLKTGMSKENKDKLLKEYLIPINCKLLQAPKLNDEMLAAVSETVRGFDESNVNLQQQVGQGITAINRAMEVLITALKNLKDACRIFSNLHYLFTKDRTTCITSSLEKDFLDVIRDCERDETLFGNTLSEKIKARNVIEEQSQQINKAENTATSRPSTSQGNRLGRPRNSSNRGRRGRNRKANPPPTP